ncbi:DNA repair protein [Gigaspora margarita]|uniref:DNA repair protein n=1 Tax=Gigaspora margarita TaxID=4874 RepID=A0A8H3X1N6_GIGMA|nr:DNA repair protein [Gigaspora margarita]
MGVKKSGLRVVNNEMVDLLTKRIPSYLITEILVNHAEAFSDSSEFYWVFTITNNFTVFQLRKVFLWSRFHMTIREYLEEQKLLGNYNSEPNAIIYEQQSLWIFMDIGNTIFSKTQKNIVESNDDDGNDDGDKKKGKKPDKLGYPPGIVPILEELLKWSCWAK